MARSSLRRWLALLSCTLTRRTLNDAVCPGNAIAWQLKLLEWHQLVTKARRSPWLGQHLLLSLSFIASSFHRYAYLILRVFVLLDFLVSNVPFLFITCISNKLTSHSHSHHKRFLRSIKQGTIVVSLVSPISLLFSIFLLSVSRMMMAGVKSS